uniref:Uncharacterized protein n=1 Tax=Anopheles culicifacies TaxID=139723 RepID=A0A182M329_9DIPT
MVGNTPNTPNGRKTGALAVRAEIAELRFESVALLFRVLVARSVRRVKLLSRIDIRIYNETIYLPFLMPYRPMPAIDRSSIMMIMFGGLFIFHSIVPPSFALAGGDATFFRARAFWTGRSCQPVSKRRRVVPGGGGTFGSPAVRDHADRADDKRKEK